MRFIHSLLMRLCHWLMVSVLRNEKWSELQTHEDVVKLHNTCELIMTTSRQL